jgi:D-glycero-alpha-D-manno-heptose-7-phosphate kinase
MITVRSRAPLRLGLAGGGTDVAPYSDNYGGSVLNATIDLYSSCTISFDKTQKQIQFSALDINLNIESELVSSFNLNGDLVLHKAVYNRIVKEYHNNQPLAVKVSTWSDAPPGSGLGTSSTLVVAMIAAYSELLSIPLGEYDMARLAYEIEREDCGLAGGKQDQYAATFGGFNFMEFYKDSVIVNPLRIRRNVELELEASLLLFYTGQSRESAKIIKDQAKAASSGNNADDTAVKAMHEVKEMAYKQKEAILKGDITSFYKNLGVSWESKKAMAKSITTPEIETIATKALSSGAKSIKISGAGGGGFMMIFVEPTKIHSVKKILQDTGGLFHDFKFTTAGVEAWSVK